jgi:hypothetical protein
MLADPNSAHPWQKGPMRQYCASINPSILARKKPNKEHQFYTKINLVSADRVREPETVDSAALLQCERQAYQYNEYGGGDRQNLAETQ